MKAEIFLLSWFKNNYSSLHSALYLNEKDKYAKAHFPLFYVCKFKFITSIDHTKTIEVKMHF